MKTDIKAIYTCVYGFHNFLSILLIYADVLI